MNKTNSQNSIKKTIGSFLVLSFLAYPTMSTPIGWGNFPGGFYGNYPGMAFNPNMYAGNPWGYRNNMNGAGSFAGAGTIQGVQSSTPDGAYGAFEGIETFARASSDAGARGF